MNEGSSDCDWHVGTAHGFVIYEILSKDECWLVQRHGCFVAAFPNRELAARFVLALCEPWRSHDQDSNELKENEQQHSGAIRFRYFTAAGRTLR